MIEPAPAQDIASLIQVFDRLRTQALSAAHGTGNLEYDQRTYLTLVENVERICRTALVGETWFDSLYSRAYWAVRDLTPADTRPTPLLESAHYRLARWLDDALVELRRIQQDDDVPNSRVARLVFDTSALLRAKAFSDLDWPRYAGAQRTRLVLPILVIRELDDLKNFGRHPKARPRLKKIREILQGYGRGPAPVSETSTLEILLDPPRHERVASHDEEIVRRAAYLKGRPGGPLMLITGDYTMQFTAEAEMISVLFLPDELLAGD